MLGDAHLAKLEQAAQDAEADAEDAFEQAAAPSRSGEYTISVATRSVAAELRAARHRSAFNREYDRSRSHSRL